MHAVIDQSRPYFNWIFIKENTPSIPICDALKIWYLIFFSKKITILFYWKYGRDHFKGKVIYRTIRKLKMNLQIALPRKKQCLITCFWVLKELKNEWCHRSPVAWSGGNGSAPLCIQSIKEYTDCRQFGNTNKIKVCFLLSLYASNSKQ